MTDQPTADPNVQAAEVAPETPAPVEAPSVTPKVPAPATASQASAAAGGKDFVWGTGRRKKSVARVRIRPGTGKFLVNKKEVDAYFRRLQDQNAARSPLEATETVTSFDVFVNVSGGGTTGQADAVCLGLARALAEALPEVEPSLRGKGLMTRDSRAKERKKFGRHGARRGMQWAKR